MKSLRSVKQRYDDEVDGKIFSFCGRNDFLTDSSKWRDRKFRYAYQHLIQDLSIEKVLGPRGSRERIAQPDKNYLHRWLRSVCVMK